MGHTPQGALAPKALRMLATALRSSLTAQSTRFELAKHGIALPVSEALERRQLLSGSVASSRGPLASLDTSLQSTYLNYQQFLAAQPAAAAIAKTKTQKLAKAAAITAASKTFQPDDSSLHVSAGDIPVEAFARPGDLSLLTAALTKLSGQKVTASGREVDALIPIADLGTLASLTSLRFAESSASVVSVGAVTSQGDVADEAAGARAAYGINGAGVKVGIISDSFNNNINKSITDTYATDVATGDLPAGVQILGDNVPGTDEGRAIAQVVYDSAPGVSLAFSTGEASGGASGQATMTSSIGALVSDGANIIVDDLTYENEPMFADGQIAIGAETAVADGVTYISAAGNLASNSYASAWRSGANITTNIPRDPAALNAPTFYGGTAFNFNTSAGAPTDTETFNLSSGQVFNPSLQWDSPYYSTGGPGTSNQVDVYVLNAAGTMVEGGSSAQVTQINGTGNDRDPIQNFSFQNSTGTTQQYQLMICCSYGSVPGHIKYVDFAGQATAWQFPQGSSTIFGHANASGVESVGAVNAANVNPPVVESYSSTGGTPIYFTPAGTLLNPPGYRQTPSIVAPDAVYTTFFGTKTGSNAYPTFSGTSAAAAEVAGLAALLKQKDPKFAPSQIDAAINNNTIAIGSSSPNALSGYGFVQALPVIANSVGNITGTVFSDNNTNSVADPGEPGLYNAIVYIDENGTGYLQANDPVTTTNSNGFFTFYNQSLGTTVVRVVTLSNYVPVTNMKVVNVLGAQTVSGVYLGLFPILYSGTSGHYNYMLQNDPTKSYVLDIYVNGTQAYNAPLSILAGGGLPFDLEGGNSSLTVSFLYGDPIPAGGITFTPTGTGNSLVFNGSATVPITAVIDSQTTTFTYNLTTPVISTIVANDLQTETLNSNGGTENFTVATAQPSGEALTFNGASGVTTVSVNDPLPNNGIGTTFNAGTVSGDQGVLNVNAGIWTFVGDPYIASSALTVNDSSEVVFAAGSAGSGISQRRLQALNISAGALALVAAPDVHADRAVFEPGSIAITSPGALDLNANDMILSGSSLAAISALLASGCNNGAWNGAGIQSSAAATDTTQFTALGVLQNQAPNKASGTQLYGIGTALGLFDGLNPAATALLIKYTYYGDTNLNGKVDGSDYSNIDSAYITPGSTGWSNGDFNYDGAIDGSDYTLLDNAFNSQGTPL